MKKASRHSPGGFFHSGDKTMKAKHPNATMTKANISHSEYPSTWSCSLPKRRRKRSFESGFSIVNLLYGKGKVRDSPLLSCAIILAQFLK